MKSRIQLGDSPASAKLAGELVCEHQNSDLHTRAIKPALIKGQACTIQLGTSDCPLCASSGHSYKPASASKAKKAIADYKKAIGRPDGMAELSIFYCEEAFSFLESCTIEDESYFAALIRMYERSLEFVSSLPLAERATFLERLDKLRSRGRHVGWGVHDELNSLWYAAALDESE
ncbi:hypothetical protein SAMN05444159_3183 [Bradyrhizobium lablabi]|uniref:Uncharacterized protein n=1 Tax=Bradyrhizobium lablabi TaxID=722472 RepID=A0A1M6S7V4_9BRAD|nr:hypothetical protein [Bradyrhizobium lablabi]SHK40783.1 hypothetical protein SAMN05444159_3183 [Bradyrhizobium lablabi]